MQNMASYLKRVTTSFLNGVYIRPRLTTAQTGAPGGADNLGAEDIVRLTIQRSPNQVSDMLDIIDENGNILAAFDNNGNQIHGGVSTVKTCSSLVTISSANITGTGAGQLGNASGVVLVADPPAGSLVELVSVMLSYTFNTAAYTGGGNISVNIDGGAALTGVVSFANSLGAGASKIVQFLSLSTAGNVLTSAKGLNLVAAAAPTQPGTAAGTVKVYTTYRLYSSL